MATPIPKDQMNVYLQEMENENSDLSDDEDYDDSDDEVEDLPTSDQIKLPPELDIHKFNSEPLVNNHEISEFDGL